MPEPTIQELLCIAFEYVYDRELHELNWPDDIDGQASRIRHLVDMATRPEWGHENQAWAYDKLVEIARDYREKGEPGQTPLEMFSWCLGVVSGAYERPKRPPGRPVLHQDMVRNHLIPAIVALLRENGHTRKSAIFEVASAANLSCQRVEKILKGGRKRNKS